MIHKWKPALLLLAASVLARGARAQSDNQMLGVQIVADQWSTDSAGHAWGKNVGLGLRDRFGGRQHVRGYVAVDGTFLHTNGAPLYFTLEAAGIYTPLRFEDTPLLPYIGAGVGSVLNLGPSSGGNLGTTTGQAVGGYYLTFGLIKSGTKNDPFVEVQYFPQSNMRRLALVIGIYGK
jgi:hypothetical protein